MQQDRVAAVVVVVVLPLPFLLKRERLTGHACSGAIERLRAHPAVRFPDNPAGRLLSYGQQTSLARRTLIGAVRDLGDEGAVRLRQHHAVPALPRRKSLPAQRAVPDLCRKGLTQEGHRTQNRFFHALQLSPVTDTLPRATEGCGPRDTLSTPSTRDGLARSAHLL